MNVPDDRRAPWLLLAFALPAKRASERVQIWRKLRRYGVLPLKSAGYLLPNNPINRERLEWIAVAVRKYKGHASVAQVLAFDDISDQDLRARFSDARTCVYEQLLKELRKLRTSAKPMDLSRIRRRSNEIVEIDFFGSPARQRLEEALARLESPQAHTNKARAMKIQEFAGRSWITRPRPGIDRAACAWFICRFIDAKARFVFHADAASCPDAIPFDMFHANGFGHEGDACSFETFVRRFNITETAVQKLGEAIHDADLGDEKFGRSEAMGVDKVLVGWASKGMSNEELLSGGCDLIEGLYLSYR